MKRAFLLLLISTTTWACDFSPDGLLKDQRAVLSAKAKNDADWIRAVDRPFACLLKAQKKTEGTLKIYAGSVLRPLLGGPLAEGIPADSRFKTTSARLERLSAAGRSLTNDSVIAEFARGEWGFFAACETCPIFTPIEGEVLKQSPLLATASLIHLRSAYLKLEGRERQKVAATLEALHRSIPRTSALQRRAIDEIYTELFTPNAPIHSPS